jgi:hypothetical protein
MRRIVLAAFGPVLIAAACDTGREVEAKLYPVSSCSELEESIRAAAIKKMEQDVETSMESFLSNLGCRYQGWRDAGYYPAADAGAALPAPPPSESSPETSGASQTSGTNNQVVGVDEADFLKNDNQYIYMVSAKSFRIVRAWPPEAAKEIAKVPIEGTPKRLFVHQDRALVYSSLDSSGYGSGNQGYGGTGSECTYGYSCDFTGDGYPTQITVFDISDRASPKRVRELRLSGSYVSSRRIGDAVHTVLSSPAVFFPGLSYTPSKLDRCNEKLSTWEIRDAFAALRTANARLIRETDLKDYLPSAIDTTYSGAEARTSESLLAQCKGFFRSGLDDGRSFTTVLSMPLTAEGPVSAATIVSRPGAVYASTTALYLAVPHERQDEGPWYSSMASEREATDIHALGLESTPPSATYQGSGLVKGRVLNQFAMDEWEGHFRIATTTGHLPSPDTHNTVAVLRRRGGTWDTVGMLDHLAPTEDIRSVRFAGPRGYVVTFKKTDPLFVLDLSDPAIPQVKGELKIPGFSTYMQAMDSGHLITIGYDADDQGSFAWFAGVSLQIFDVADELSPKLVHREIIGTRGSSSEALTNHLAFTYFPPKNLLAIPMTICEDGSGGSYGSTMTFSGLMVYDVTVQNGFKLRGKVAHSGAGDNWCGNWWTDARSEVRRSIVMDDYVFSISDHVIKVNPLNDLSLDLATLPIDG